MRVSHDQIPGADATGRGKRRLRVVLGCDWFLKYALQQARGLVDAGAEVLLVCRDHAMEFGGSAVERALALREAEETGVRVHVLRGRQRSATSLNDLWTLRRTLTDWRPDVFHVHEGVDPRLGVLMRGAVVVLTIHDVALHPGQVRDRHPLKHALAQTVRAYWRRKASLTVVHGPRLEVAYRAAHPRRRTVSVPHGLECAPEPASPPPVRRVSLLGRLEPYKGVEILDESLPLIWEARPDIQVMVAGVGSCVPTLRDPRLEVRTGYFRDADVGMLLDRSSVVLLPYTEASMSGIGSQAVGRGIPVIVSDRGELPSLALDPSWVLPDPTAAALAHAVLAHVDHDARVRCDVLENVARPRAWDSVGRTLVRLYRELLSGSEPGR